MDSNVVVRGNRSTIDWGKALVAGVIAMAVFALIEMAAAWALRGGSPLKPLDIFGAIALAQFVPVQGHTAATALAGAFVLLALGVVAGVIIALLVHRLSPVLALAVGASFGLAMYYVDLHGFARVFPSLAELRGGMSVLAYAVQGGLTAGLYKAMNRSLADVVPEHAGRDMRRLREVPLV